MPDDTTVLNDYSYWQKALADPKALHAREFTITEEPQPGFYRTHDLKPVAIWNEEDGCVVMIHDEVIDSRQASDTWIRVAKHPVSEESYRAVLDGGRWPDTDDFLQSIGSNRMAAADPVELIDELAEQAEKYLSIDSEEEASQAVSLRNALLAKGKEVDAKRDEQKRPFLDKCREIDMAWMPPVKKAEKAAKYLRVLIESYRTKVLKKQREEEEARRKAAEAKKAPPPAEKPVVPDQIRSGHGKAASVKAKVFVVGISDFLAACAELQDETELQSLVMKLAQKRLDADGEVIPGVITEERAVVR